MCHPAEIDKLLVKMRHGCHYGAMRSEAFGHSRVPARHYRPLGRRVSGRWSCGGDSHPGPIPVGQSTQTLESGGVTRTFHLYRPQGLTEPRRSW